MRLYMKLICKIGLKISLYVMVAVYLISFQVSAEENGISLGNVPIAKNIKIDGEKDPLYNNGLILFVGRKEFSNTTDGATAKIYMLWEPEYVYVYAEIIDPSLKIHTEEEVYNSPAATESFEIFINEDNKVLVTAQYRISSNGYPSGRKREGSVSFEYFRGPGESNGKFEYAHKEFSNGYAVEYKIPISVSKKAGDVIGFFAQINDYVSNTVNKVFLGNTRGAVSWDVELYDYVTLSHKEASEQYEDVTMDSTANKTVNYSLSLSSPETGDNIIFIVILFIVTVVTLVFLICMSVRKRIK